MSRFPDIRSKLGAYLGKEDYLESEVVYFLVESYKLLEKKNSLDSYNAIRFYRNWACHSALSRDAIKIFDEVYVLIRAKKYLNRLEWNDLMTDEIINSFRKVSFAVLKKEIDMFVERFLYQGIKNPEKIIWKQFREKLYEIIRDTPLLIKKGEAETLRFECKKVINQINFDDLSIRVVAAGNTFNVSRNDGSL